jgi:hypothetical protein
MHDVSRHVARRAGLLALAACLFASCTEEAPNRETAPSRTASASPTPSESVGGAGTAVPQPTPDQVPRGLPTLSARANAATVARQLDRVSETLRDPDATATDVRRAAEFQQLAVRTLATRSDAFRQKVIGELHPETSLFIRSDVRAARLLHAISRPQPALPRWRIVAPPPARKLLGYYREAERRIGVPWAYLAAIHLVETRMGRIRGVSTAGAHGPMQFLPSTWELYGAGGDIDDPRDAILAAARLLRANGAPGHMADALWHYNQSDNYVRAVTEHARAMQRSRVAYRGYWHWRVLYRHTRGTYVLPVGYPGTPAVLVAGG